MKITKNVEYGITALTYIAEYGGAPVSVKKVALETEIPQALLAKIFQSFVKSGILVSVQGKSGCYSLSKRPSKINLSEILNSLEEKISISPANAETNIYIAGLTKVQNKVERIFTQTKLSDLIKNYKEKIMKHLNEILQNKIAFFKFMSKKFPVKYKSNIFLRDVQFAIKDYFDLKKVKLSYTETENMAKELMKNLVEAGEAEQLTEKSWEFLLKIED